MTKSELFDKLKKEFQTIIFDNNINEEYIKISCRALSEEEAIGITKRKDFPIITGKEVMIQAEYKGCFGQAFTDSPAIFNGSLKDILELDIVNNDYDRSLFIATINAVMKSLNKCNCTVHCRNDGPELCAKELRSYLDEKYPNIKRIALIGYQPAILSEISKGYEVRVLDLSPVNVGEVRYGIKVEHGIDDFNSVVNDFAELVLCTGSTLCNGSIINFINIDKEVLFFGTTLSGSADILNLNKVCFADKYQ